MALILLCLLVISTSEQVLEYRLSKNFGETFHDYSGNLRDGVNGKAVGEDAQDTTPSDRGAYFSGTQSMIYIPEQDLQGEKIEFSAPYSIIIWANIISGDLLGDDADIPLINRVGSGGDELKLNLSPTMDVSVEVTQIEPSVDSNSSGSSAEAGSGSNSGSGGFGSESSGGSHESSSSNNALGSSSGTGRWVRHLSVKRNLSVLENGKWTLLRLKINSNTLEIFINEESKATHDISAYSEVNQNYMMYIGGSPNKATSMNGYVWSLAVDTNFLKDDYMPTTTLACSAAYFEGGEYKCFSEELNINKNSLGVDCTDGCSSCNSYTCLSCKCSVSSCEMSGSQNLCICPSDSIATETSCECPDDKLYTGYSCEYCTLSKCLECKDIKTCSQCEDTYSIINGKCECAPGTYETTSGCKKCVDGCDSCDNSKDCLECLSGYYLDSTYQCKACGNNCAQCDETKCITCFETFLKVDESNCACEDGYEDFGVCIRKRFQASIKVDSNNVVTIQFNSSLSKALEYEDFVIDCSDVKEPSIKFKAKSTAKYEFHVTSDYEIKSGSVFKASLKNLKLTSKDDSLYYKTTLQVNLRKAVPVSEASKILTSNAKVVVGASLGAAATAGIFGDTSFFWILLNTLQIITYLPLNSTPYTETLVKFFTFINFLNLFPSVHELLGI